MADAPSGILVIQPGAAVKLDGGVDGLVTAVAIREGGKVTYEVVWWNDRTREREWLEACEVVMSHPGNRDDTMAVTFLNGERA